MPVNHESCPFVIAVDLLIREGVESDFSICERIIENISQVIVGKRQVLELLLVAFIADGHALIEDVPGLGKTLMAKSLAKTIGGTFERVQFTPDLLPADITGFSIYYQQAGQVESV